MRVTLPILALGLALVAVPAAAAPLCRDLKGLFTPCTARAVEQIRRHEAEVAAKQEKVAAEHPDRPRRTHPPLVTRGRLCRDSKGLFTPCASGR